MESLSHGKTHLRFLIRATTQGGVQLGFDAEEAMKMSMYTALGAATLHIWFKKVNLEELISTCLGGRKVYIFRLVELFLNEKGALLDERERSLLFWA